MIFLSRDENNVLHVGVEEIEYYGHNFNRSVAPSNYPIRVVNNKFGKVIVIANGYARVVQILLANINSLILKDKMIDYYYLMRTFVNKFKDVLKKQFLDYEENETGSAKTFIDIMIIANKKMYLIRDDAIIECENQYYGNTDFYTNIATMLYENETHHGDKFIVKMFDRINSICNSHFKRILLINDEDYKVRVIKLGKEN